MAKLMKIEKQDYKKKSGLMPGKYRSKLATQRSINMLSMPLEPYKIKYRKTVPKFLIDKENFQWYRNDQLSSHELSKIQNQIHSESSSLSRHLRHRSEDM